jgi:hypothetical protein
VLEHPQYRPVCQLRIITFGLLKDTSRGRHFN